MRDRHKALFRYLSYITMLWVEVPSGEAGQAAQGWCAMALLKDATTLCATAPTRTQALAALGDALAACAGNDSSQYAPPDVQ